VRQLFFVLLLAVSCIALANEHGGGGGGGPADAVKLDNFVVNLKDRQAFLSFTPYLKLFDAKDQDRVKAYMPVIRYEIIKAMIGQPPENVGTPQFIESTAKSITSTLNRILNDDVIKAVYFNDWIVQ
jgi:flagellar basal body-associated protein FliL